ncbi:hypothetical protein [Tautonia rosea]|uniref:hypothetical protein n=1 Tax=Tautonia rosea TaxID=2728037 RepID=UPI00147291C8|nr:hypothetical protein [Tautonia rosea]
MQLFRRNAFGFVIGLSLMAVLSLPGCGEKPPPPVEIDEIDFEEAEQEATKEYGGAM